MEKDALKVLRDISESDAITASESGRCVNGIRENSIKLLGMNVGRNNVCPVIESVLELFTNKQLEGPPAATTGNFFVEVWILTKIQAAMAIAEKKFQHCIVIKHQSMEEKQVQFRWQLTGDLMLWDFLTMTLVQPNNCLIQ